MKMGWFVITALPVLAALASPARSAGSTAPQEEKEKSSKAATGGLKRVREEPREDGQAFDRDAWEKKLGASDLTQREKAFDDLVELARRDGEVREAVEGWSKSGHGSELAWTSRLLLREIDRDGGAGLLRGGNPNWLGSGFDWQDFSRRFEDLDSMFGDLRQEWGHMLHSMPAPSAGSKSSSRSLTLESGPDGVTCKVTEKQDDGQDHTNTYKAGSVEELLEAHPELRGELGGGGFQLFHGLPDGGVLVAPRGLRRTDPGSVWSLRTPESLHDALTPSDEDSPRTDRLGILCDPVEGGVGLTVQEVTPGSIASQLGLRHGDVVTEINGTTIHSREDVKKILAERSADADVAVKVTGDDGRGRTLTWRPKPPPAGEKAGKKQSSRNF